MVSKDYDICFNIQFNEGEFEEKMHKNWFARNILNILMASVIMQLVTFLITASILLVTSSDLLYITNIIGLLVAAVLFLVGYYEKVHINYLFGITVLIVNVLALII